MRKNKKAAFSIANNVETPLFSGINVGMAGCGINDYWSYGGNNMFPYALAVLSRSSLTHRRILNDKASYIAGKGFSCDERNIALKMLIANVNNKYESLRNMLRKVAYDYTMTGNGYVEVVTGAKGNFLSLFHQDSVKCRLSKNKDSILLSGDWTQYSRSTTRELPLFPQFKRIDGFMRSIFRYSDYEPMFENYGVPSYVAGLKVAAIAYKTDAWNISRLDNSFQYSGIMEIDSDKEEEENQALVDACKKAFGGKPGQVLFLGKNMVDENRGSKFTPIQSSNEGDWKALHEQSVHDMVIAHSWFPTLSGLDYSTGFNADRILNEYQVAMSTCILDTQEFFLSPLQRIIGTVLKMDASSLQFINRPPVITKPGYMKVWEARKLDGLEYDEKDTTQQTYIANLNKNNDESTDNSPRGI